MQEETLFGKILIAVMFTAFVLFWCWVPDFLL